jgi:hypothetical protein
MFSVSSWNSKHGFPVPVGKVLNVLKVLNQVPWHEEVWGNGGIASYIPNLGTRCKWVVSFTRLPYPWGKRPWHPMDRRPGGPQCQSGHSGKKKKNPCPCQELNPSCPACSCLTILTKLPQLFTSARSGYLSQIVLSTIHIECSKLI